MKKQGTFKKHILLFFAVLFLCFSFSNPCRVYAEKTDLAKEATNITAMSVVLFYAGVIGALVGAATGWVNAWFFNPESDQKSVQEETNKP